MTFQWRIGEPRTAIPGGNLPLHMLSTPPAASSVYDCVITNPCGSVTTQPVTLTICATDYNCSQSVTVADVFAFLTGWFVGDPFADIDGVGGVQISDLFAFLADWFAGC